MSAHTPGPWEVATDGYYPVILKRFRADHHMDICSAVHGYMYAEDEKANQAANARLIAAAPELLAALKAMLVDFEYVYADGEPAVIAARAAIAKATGAA